MKLEQIIEEISNLSDEELMEIHDFVKEQLLLEDEEDGN
jgi:uncharacterized protein YqgQ